MTWDYFVPFSIAALHFWGFGAFAAWRGRKPYVAYLDRACYLLLLYCGNMDFPGTSAYADDGRDAPVVLFLSSTGRTHHIQSLEV